MIKESTPLTLAEVSNLVGDSEKAEKVKVFIKKAGLKPLDLKKVIALKEELRGLGILKLKEDYIVKIVDFLPEDGADLSKVLPEVSLDQDEVVKIIEVVKKY